MNGLIVLALVAVAHAAPQNFFPINSFAIPTVLPDGHLADTPEVASAKLAHYAEVAKATGGRSFTPFFDAPVFPSGPVNQYQSLSNPLAGVEVYPTGFIADTADVAKAKAIHYAAIAKERGLSDEPYLRYISSLP